MKDRIVWVGRHEGLLRDVARGCAYGDPPSLVSGAKILSAFIKPDSVLVPMPSHIGYATTMYDLCRHISKHVHARVYDCLECIPHESSHIQKLRMGLPPEIHMYIKKIYPSEKGWLQTDGRNIIIIDNTVCTGATASAALDVIPNATVLAITKG